MLFFIFILHESSYLWHSDELKHLIIPAARVTSSFPGSCSSSCCCCFSPSSRESGKSPLPPPSSNSSPLLPSGFSRETRSQFTEAGWDFSRSFGLSDSAGSGKNPLVSLNGSDPTVSERIDISFQKTDQIRAAAESALVPFSLQNMQHYKKCSGSGSGSDLHSEQNNKKLRVALWLLIFRCVVSCVFIDQINSLHGNTKFRTNLFFAETFSAWSGFRFFWKR